jgi:polar amino acid transport system substrate-binding protein
MENMSTETWHTDPPGPRAIPNDKTYHHAHTTADQPLIGDFNKICLLARPDTMGARGWSGGPQMMRSTAVAALAVIGAVALAGCSDPSDDGRTVGSASGPGAKSAKIVARVAKDQRIAAMLPPAVAKRGTVTAAINPDVAPVKYIDDSGKITGVSPDLLRAAGRLLGITVSFQKTSFDAQVPGLEAKRFDLIAAAGDFVERQTHVDFIDFLQGGTAILGAKGLKSDTLTPKDLCGVTIGYARGSAQQGLLASAEKACADAKKPKIEMNAYSDANSGLLAVQSGQADAFWGDLAPMVLNATSKPDQFKIVYRQRHGNYGIGVSKNDPQLRDALRAALKQLVNKGVYAQLLRAFGQQDYGTSSLPMNSNVRLES